MIIATPSESTDTNKSANFLVSRRKLKPEAVERMASRAELAGRYRDVQSEDDLRAIVEIGDLIFGASNVSDETLLELFSSWWRKNPEIFHVLDVEGSIEGFTSLLPLRPEKIESIIREEIRMSDISESDILPFEPGSPVQLFVHVVGVRPHPQSRGAVKRNFGGQLVSGIAQTFLDFGRRGIHITSVEARSNTYDGINLSTQLGFEEVPPPSGVKKKVFRLDTSTASLLGEYRNLLEKNSEGGSLSEEDERTL